MVVVEIPEEFDTAQEFLDYCTTKWFTGEGNPDFDPRCDIEPKDGFIDVYDIAAIAQQVGKEIVPPPPPPPEQPEGTSNRYKWKAKSKVWRIEQSNTPPTPPSDAEIKSHFDSDGKVAEAIGEFVQKMVDAGHQVTILGYSTQVGKEFIRSGMTGGYIDHYWKEYRTHVRLVIDFTSTPECFLTESPLIVTSGAIVAIGIAIGAIITAAGVFYALQNLTTVKETYTIYGWVKNPNTGEWEYIPVEEGEKTRPPEWSAYTPAIIIVIALLFLLMFFGSRRR